MIALLTIILFFFLLVLIYPMVCALLTLAAWCQKHGVRGKREQSELVASIETRTDRLKNKVFMISVILLFFGVAPFAALWLVTNFF